MNAVALWCERRAFHGIYRTIIRSRITPRLHQIISSSFTFSTQNPDVSSELGNQTQDLREEELRNCLSWKIEKLARGQAVLSAFQSWMGDGFPVHRGDIFHAVNRLRKLNMNKRALEVMEWVIRERPYKLKELDYSYLLEFTIKLHGISQGERLFSRVPPEFQNELLFNNLVMACLEKAAIRLSLAYMKKMRELGHPISPYVFNRLIILHSSPGRRKAIPRILTQMKADGVVPHVSTYNILLKIEANQHNIQGLTKVFDDMKRAQVEPNEITYCILATAHAVARLYAVSEAYVEAVEKVKTGDNWSTLDVLLMLYGYLGKEKELECTWGVVQQLPHVRNKSFVLSIEAFGRIGRLNRSEEIWLEMKSSKQLRYTEQYNSIISIYCKHGLVDKASELFKEMEISVCNANAITYRHLALSCLKAGLVKEALKTLEVGMDQTTTTKVRRSAPWLETTHSIVEIFADMGDIENVKKLFGELKESRYTRYTFVYNTLIRAHVKAKVYDPDLLRKMILGGARPDDETYSLLKLLEQFRN
ncbi:pentatricopeptide repeat-containing protein At1g07590, mitochondrial-like [Telopea speciosissima]|uniref:pentatricopeptide repeat-containing protein At1g07590, mitochondrial-like n=1 Tax=Telopea speciosissima TaxID=54955 RepID=UPI001CC3438E|nr:pentatricopeptide repeat-containing protein At1g07590, mitochondrial-like [Telopea speciosissima]